MDVRCARQRSEQYFTSSQTFAHFLRQANGRPHVAQGFCGSVDFVTRGRLAVINQTSISIWALGFALRVAARV
jgi:hypothetical protein